MAYEEYTDDELRAMAGSTPPGDEPYSEYSDEQLMQMAGRDNVPPDESPLSLNSLNESLLKRATNIEKTMTERPQSPFDPLPQSPEEGIVETMYRAPGRALRAVGQVGGLINDVASQGIEAAYKTFVPQSWQDSISETVAPVVKAVALPLGEAYRKVKAEYPQGMENLEAVGNIAMAGGLAKGVLKTAGYLSVAAKEGTGILGDVASFATRKTPEAIEQELKTAIRPVLEKTILSRRGKGTAKDVEQYLNKGTDSTVDIALNKEKLVYHTPDGGVIEGQLPKNLSQWKDSVYQREGEIFKEYDAMNKAAGGKGATVDLNSLADKLEAYGKDKVILTENPLAAKYATQKAAQYRNAGSYTAEEAQQAMVELNSKFEAFLKSPSPEKAVDVISGNNIRQELYNAVMQSEGPGYEKLRKTFGAHKTIEADVTKKAIGEMAKSSNVDWLDIIAGAEFTTGLLALNPYMMTRAGIYEGLKRSWKYYKSPNRAIKNMFSDAERILDSKNTGPRSRAGQMIPEKPPEFDDWMTQGRPF
jgi:hypothetical protein